MSIPNNCYLASLYHLDGNDKVGVRWCTSVNGEYLPYQTEQRLLLGRLCPGMPIPKPDRNVHLPYRVVPAIIDESQAWQISQVRHGRTENTGGFSVDVGVIFDIVTQPSMFRVLAVVRLANAAETGYDLNSCPSLYHGRY